MTVQPSEYLHRKIIPIRNNDLWGLGKERQDNAIARGRRPNFRGSSYEEEVFKNVVGLCGESVDMVWLHGLVAGMPVRWLRFKDGDIHNLPDQLVGTSWHTIIDDKTNDKQHPENFLLLKLSDLPDDRWRDHWIFVHHYIASCEWVSKWKFKDPDMVTTGWCFGWEIRQVGVSRLDADVPVPGIYNISVTHPIMKPMLELARLIKLRERYGPADGELRWERGERI